MTRVAAFCAALAATMLVAGCASIVEGTDQTLSMNISPKSAVCTVSQKGDVIATLDNGGGQIQVPKSKDDLDIDCAAVGYDRQTMSIESSASGWGVVGCFLIDLCITDYSTGALNKYPKTITVNLRQQAVAVPANPTNATPPQAPDAQSSAYRNGYSSYSGYPHSAPPQVQDAGPQSYRATYPPAAYPPPAPPEGSAAPALVQPSAGP